MIGLSAIVWDVDPAMFSIGSFELRYYALFWILGFAQAMYFFTKMLRKEGLNPNITENAFMYAAISTVVGARLGHCLFYEPDYYLANPLSILNLREGGLASHGAAIGLLIGLWLFSRRYKFKYIWTLDRVVTVVPAAGALVRIGNLINSEVYGTATDLPFGFIFVRAGETVPMHPTQIYEALAYFIIAGILMFLYFKKDLARRFPGLLFGVFLVLLFLARFIIESIKQPQEEFEKAMQLNMGQILSLPFIIVGIIAIIISLRRGEQKAEPIVKSHGSASNNKK